MPFHPQPKMMALVLVAVMMFAMGTAALAVDGDVTITVPEGDTHTYEVYQIFTGTVADKVLSDVRWGQNGTGETGTAVSSTILDELEGVKDSTDTAQLAVIEKYATLSNPIVSTLTNEKSASVAPGYYLIKDVDSVTLGAGDEHTLYIVEVLGDFQIARKAGSTTSDKTLSDVNDSTDAAATPGQTSSDYDIGDDVPYHLSATISSEVGQYPKYHMTFKDTLESGKFDAISDLDIKIDGKTAAEINNDESADYTVEITGVENKSVNGFEVKVEFTPKTGKDLSSLKSKSVTIDFTAKLGTGAAIGSEGNSNTLVLSYSNNPNETDGYSEGTTPEKKVITFTYKVVVDKVDEEEAPLAGAEFTLYKVTKNAATAGVTGTDAKAKNEAWASNGGVIATLNTNPVAGTDGTTLNRFSFDGIDDGYYVLCETTTPSGYNTMEPKVFKVEATHGGDNGLTLTDLNGTAVTGEITLNKDVTNGSLSTTIQNNKGTELPSTGGIGTTIFYIIGAILVIGAGVILVTRRRMGNAK